MRRRWAWQPRRISRRCSGGNPTSTWQPGELIVDQAVLHVAADAQPGEYSLNVGMYDPASGARAPLANRDGAPLADQQTSLATYSVGESMQPSSKR
jgi:hypothetical protein